MAAIVAGEDFSPPQARTGLGTTTWEMMKVMRVTATKTGTTRSSLLKTNLVSPMVHSALTRPRIAAAFTRSG